MAAIAMARNDMSMAGIVVGATGGVVIAAALAWRVTRRLLPAGLSNLPRRPPSSPVASPDLGAVAELLPGTHVAECTVRQSPAIGVLSDGQGFAAVLEVLTASRLDVGELARSATSDPARLSGVQIIVEQSAAGRRTLVAVRYEPVHQPAAAAERGGGLVGAHRTVAAAVLRTRRALRQRGVTATPLAAAAVRALVRELGDGSPTGTVYPNAWVTAGAAHCVLAATPKSTVDWTRLLTAAAATPADRSVVALSIASAPANRANPTWAAVRLVARDNARAAAARATLIRSGAATTLTGAQPIGVHLTLPFGGPQESLAHAIGTRR